MDLGSGRLTEVTVGDRDAGPLELGLDPETLEVALDPGRGLAQLVLDLEQPICAAAGNPRRSRFYPRLLTVPP